MSRIGWAARAAALMVLAWPAVPVAAAETAGLLHPLFQDHAVLQRDQPIAVWGQARAGEVVSVTFAGQAVTTHADATGRWQATLPATGAGGPYTLEAAAGPRRESVRDVLVGDVWLCAGQSNMELPVWRSLNAASEIAAATIPRIRLFTVPHAAAVQAQAHFNGRRMVAGNARCGPRLLGSLLLLRPRAAAHGRRADGADPSGVGRLADRGLDPCRCTSRAGRHGRVP